jgi:hypothetical protein
VRKVRLLNPSVWALIGSALVLAGSVLPWAYPTSPMCNPVHCDPPFIPGILTFDGLFTVACGFAATVCAVAALRQRDVRLPMLMGVLASVGYAVFFAVPDWLDSYGNGSMGGSSGLSSSDLFTLAPGFYVVEVGIALAAGASLAGIVIGLFKNIALLKERRAGRPSSA